MVGWWLSMDEPIAAQQWPINSSNCISVSPTRCLGERERDASLRLSMTGERSILPANLCELSTFRVLRLRARPLIAGRVAGGNRVRDHHVAPPSRWRVPTVFGTTTVLDSAVPRTVGLLRSEVRIFRHLLTRC
jgi:hypothetical protein